MTEIGICCAKCKIKSKCFFVKPYFLCYHTQCYNTTNKFLCCIKCGESRFRSYFKFNDGDIVLNNTTQMITNVYVVVKKIYLLFYVKLNG
jgi:hypothetical protein